MCYYRHIQNNLWYPGWLATVREDLYYRLNVVEIYIPALRDRRDDLDMLTHLILTRQSAETKLAFCGIDAQVLKVFHAYAWPYIDACANII